MASSGNSSREWMEEGDNISRILHSRFSTIPPAPYLVFQAIFLSLTLVATVLGNIAVCYIVYRTRSYRTVTGMCMTSLAVSDLLRGCFVLPFVIESSIELGHWTLGPWVCSLAGFFNTMFGSASVMNLSAVTVDRYMAIIKPLKYTTICTTKRAAGVLAIIWTLSATLAIMPAVGWSTYRFIPWTCFCVSDWAESKSYAYTYLAVAFFLPLCILLYCYYKIYRIARRQSRRVVSLELASIELSRSHNSAIARTRPKTFMRKEKKAVVILFAVIGVFTVCVMPYCLVYLVSSYDVSDSIYVVLGFTSLLSFVNSAANPLVYGILNRKFRRAFVEFITCRYNPCRRRSMDLSSVRSSIHPEGFIPGYNGDDTSVATRKVRKPLPRDSGYVTSGVVQDKPNGGTSLNVFAITVAATSNTCIELIGCRSRLNEGVRILEHSKLPATYSGPFNNDSVINVKPILDNGDRRNRVVCFKGVPDNTSSNPAASPNKTYISV